jgi:hypothetical protein
MVNIVFTVFTTIVVSVYCIDGGVAAFRSSSSVVVSPSFVLATRGGASDGSESSSSSSNNSKHDAKLEIAKSKAIERAYVKVCGVRFNFLYLIYTHWRLVLCDRS